MKDNDKSYLIGAIFGMIAGAMIAATVIDINGSQKCEQRESE